MNEETIYLNRTARDNAIAELIAIHYSEFVNLCHQHRMKLMKRDDQS